MTDYEMHEPDFSGTTTDEWDDPQLEDLADELRSDVEELIDELANDNFEEADFGE
ncbi:hypothetical protein [Natronococcus sp.]|uniref:hypothetical protein n=1 Tax=Natronococcus sp. TaxID=35747 RepID=UPI003A4E5EC4